MKEVDEQKERAGEPMRGTQREGSRNVGAHVVSLRSPEGLASGVVPGPHRQLPSDDALSVALGSRSVRGNAITH